MCSCPQRTHLRDLRWFQSRTVDAVQMSEGRLGVVMDCLFDWFCGLHSIAKCKMHRQLAEEAASLRSGSQRGVRGKWGQKGAARDRGQEQFGFSPDYVVSCCFSLPVRILKISCVGKIEDHDMCRIGVQCRPNLAGSPI